MELVRGTAKNSKVGVVDRGLVGWLMCAFDSFRASYLRRQMGPVRQMQVLETLQLGGRRQLLIVSCGVERYLVGCGADQVHTMLHLRADDAGCNAQKLAEGA